MPVDDGTYQLGPENGRLLVRTGRTGLGRRAGHDLLIEATRWEGSATIDSSDAANSSVRIDVDADSLEVREGTGGVLPLTDSNRAEIKETIRNKVLDTRRYPEITFRSTSVSGSPQSFAVEGDLTIVGVTKPATVQGVITGDGRAQGTSTVVQTRFGIKPYAGFFGALKLADEVGIEFDIGLGLFWHEHEAV
jgi:polyisoprenoid-binding protein YceI